MCQGCIEVRIGSSRNEVLHNEEKLLLVLHIRNLENTALAKQTYTHQLKFDWEGPVKECRQFCVELGIPDLTQVKATKQQFKAMATEACCLLDEKDIKQNIF